MISRRLRRRPAILLPFLVLLAGTAAFGQEEVEEMWAPDRPNGIAAKVEGRIITFEEVRREMAPLLKQIYRRSGDDAELERNLQGLQRDVLRNLVDKILIVEEFEKQEMKVPKSYLEGEFNEVIQEDFNGERDRFLTYLRSRDKTVRDFREELKERIIVQIMKQRMRRNQAEVSPEMIKEFYEENKGQFQREKEVKLYQLTLNPSPGGESLEERTAAVIGDLEEGVPFPEVARERSDDALAKRGGSLGWVERGDLREELAEVVFVLEAGETSDPIPFQRSILFFHVEEVREPGAVPLAEVRDEIEDILLDRIARESQERWLQRLREKAYIEYYI
jgi:peptidyl-prolyl cis-trans isomerase SurA